MGVRNHVIILPVDDLANAAAEAVANNIKGALAIPHAYGRLQFGADLDLHFRTLIGTGCNPNVAAVVVIGIEEEWTNRIVKEIGALAAVLGGIDALVFTAGIGENGADIRARIVAASAWLGLTLDPAANAARHTDFSAAKTGPRALMVPTDEELMIARHTRRLLGL